MKTLPLALILTLSLGTTAVLAETIVNGVIYPEITDLGKPRPVPAQPQLGSYTQRPAIRVAQLPPAPLTGSRPTTIPPADVQPALTVTSSGGPTVQSVPAYNQAAYGYGYTSVGTPQRVVYVVPASYNNTLPTQQVINVQPLGGVQPLGSAYNPYAAPAPSVPWRPIGNLRSMPENYVVGQGIIGQPKVYVPGQPIRNFFRYIGP